MSATTISAPTSSAASISHGLRIALVAMAIVALLAVTFLVGRATGTTKTTLPVVPTTAVATNTSTCHMGRPC